MLDEREAVRRAREIRAMASCGASAARMPRGLGGVVGIRRKHGRGAILGDRGEARRAGMRTRTASQFDEIVAVEAGRTRGPSRSAASLASSSSASIAYGSRAVIANAVSSADASRTLIAAAAAQIARPGRRQDDTRADDALELVDRALDQRRASS